MSEHKGKDVTNRDASFATEQTALAIRNANHYKELLIIFANLPASSVCHGISLRDE